MARAWRRLSVAPTLDVFQQEGDAAEFDLTQGNGPAAARAHVLFHERWVIKEFKNERKREREKEASSDRENKEREESIR